MAKVERTASLNASADTVWNVIGDFADLGWYPGNRGTKTEMVDGKLQRIVPLPGGAELREQQEQGGGAHSYTYSIASGPMPVSDYLATLAVAPEGDGCVVTWSATFEPAGLPEDKVVDIIAGVFDAGLKSLPEKF